MKQLDEYTNAELAALTDDEITQLVNQELMRSGVAIPGERPPEFRESCQLRGKGTGIWAIFESGGYQTSRMDIGFTSEENAKKFLELNPIQITTDYASKRTKVGEFTYSVAEIVNTAIETLEEKTIVEAIKMRRAIYQDALGEWEASYSAYQEIVDKICGAISKAKCNQAEANRLLETYAKYITTAGGDEAIALSFMKVNFQEKITRLQEFLSGTDLEAKETL